MVRVRCPAGKVDKSGREGRRLVAKPHRYVSDERRSMLRVRHRKESPNRNKIRALGRSVAKHLTKSKATSSLSRVASTIRSLGTLDE